MNETATNNTYAATSTSVLIVERCHRHNTPEAKAVAHAEIVARAADGDGACLAFLARHGYAVPT